MAAAMRAETDALVARVVFERRGDYFDLFNATETFVNDTLADALRADAARERDGRLGLATARARAGASCRTARCSPPARSSTTPAPRCAACSCATGCSARPSRRRRRPSRSTSRRRHDRRRVQGRPLRRAPQRRLRHLPQPDRSDRLRPGELRSHRRLPDRRQGQPAVHDLRRRRGRSGLGTFNGPAGLADLIAGSGNLESCLVTQLYRMALGPARERRRHARRCRS